MLVCSSSDLEKINRDGVMRRHGDEETNEDKESMTPEDRVKAGQEVMKAQEEQDRLEGQLEEEKERFLGLIQPQQIYIHYIVFCFFTYIFLSHFDHSICFTGLYK